jgi:hypothetical protein
MNKCSLSQRLAGPIALILFSICPMSSGQEPSSNPCVGLEPGDHTLIIAELQQNIQSATGAAKELQIEVLQRGVNDAADVLAQLIESGVFGDDVLPRAKAAQECLSVIAETVPPDDWDQAIRKVSDELEQATSPEAVPVILYEMIDVVSDINEISEVVRAVSAVMEDGVDEGLYDPGQDLFQQLEEKGEENILIPNKTAKTHAIELAIADGRGGLAGAAAGCAAGLVGLGGGCAPGAIGGAVAGAVGSSVSELLEKALKYLDF